MSTWKMIRAATVRHPTREEGKGWRCPPAILSATSRVRLYKCMDINTHHGSQDDHGHRGCIRSPRRAEAREREFQRRDSETDQDEPVAPRIRGGLEGHPEGKTAGIRGMAETE